MATRTISDSGGTRAWSDVLSWVEGAVPTAADDVVATATSGSVTISGNSVCRSIDLSLMPAGSVFTINTGGASAILSVGNATGGAVNLNGAYTLVNTSGGIHLVASTDNGGAGWLIDLGSKTNLIILSCRTAGGKWVLARNIQVSTFSILAGTFDTANYNMQLATFACSGSTAHTVILGTSTLNISSGGGGGGTFTAVTATTISATSATINVYSNALGGVLNTFNGAGKTYGAVTIDVVGTGYQNPTITGTNTFATLYVKGGAVKTYTATISDNQTVTGALTLNGNSATNRLLITSNTLGTQRTITNTGATVTASNVDFRDIGLSTATDLSAITGGSGDCLGNSGITFTTSETQNWTNTSGGNWDAVANWSGRVPLPQDDVTFNCVFTTSRTVTANMPRLGRSIDFRDATWTTALTYTPSIGVEVHGSFYLKTGMSIGTAQAITFRARITTAEIYTGGAPLPATVISTPTGVYTALSSLYVGATGGSDLTITAGTLAAQTYDLECGIFSIPGSLSVLSGSGTYTLSQLDIGTNATINITNSTVAFRSSGADRSNTISGTKTLGNITFAPSAKYHAFIGAGFTFSNITMASAGTKEVRFLATATYTMTGNDFLSGTPGNNITVKSSTTGGTNTNWTLSKSSGVVSSDYLTMNDSTATGGASFYAGANSTLTDCPGWINTAPPSGNALFFGRGF